MTLLLHSNLEMSDILCYRVASLTIANSFCDYFTKIAKRLSDNIATPKFKVNEYMNQNPLDITNSIFFSPTDTHEISKLITSLKAEKKILDMMICRRWLLKPYQQKLLNHYDI